MVLRLIALVLMVLVAPFGGEVTAQDGSSVYSVNRPGTNTGGPLQWFLGVRGRPDARVIRVTPEPRRVYAPSTRSSEPRRRSTYATRPQVQPERQPTIPTAPGDPSDTPLPDGAAPSQSADAAPVAPTLPPVHVAVIGDSLSVFLAQGLQETYAEKPNVIFVRRHREASGLVRDDYYDWTKQLRDLIATTPRIDAILLQVGSNDRQQLRDADGVHEPRSARWLEIYNRRVDEIITIAREKRIPLIWVGLPAMRSERYSADIMAFNELYKSRTALAATTFVDIWEAFTGEDGAYVVNGPDVDGTNVRLRTADGVHFTKAGARKLAFFADKELKKIVATVENRALPPPAALASATAPGLPSTALPAITAPGGLAIAPLPEPGLPPQLLSDDALLDVPLPEAPLPTALAPRQQQGPVISLNAAPVASGGTLVPAGTGVASPDRRLPSDDIFRNGLPSQSKSGRADDFRLGR